MDFREFRGWQREAKYRQALRQMDAIRAQQFVWMEEDARQAVMDGLMNIVKAHEAHLEPERTAEEETARCMANLQAFGAAIQR